MFRAFVVLVLVAALACAAAFVVAGRGAPPQLTIVKPDRVIGQSGTLEVTAEAPHARFNTLTISLEQNGKSLPLFALGSAAAGATVTPAGENNANRIRITRPIGKRDLPELQSGAAKIV